MLMRRTSIVAAALLFALLSSAQGTGVKKRRPRPEEFGNVVMNNFAEKNGVAPVVFSHWVHRAKFTCRLCHVDIGFAMQANQTLMHEDDNRRGLYCGACHNGRTAFHTQPVKTAAGEQQECDRCHRTAEALPHRYDFATFTAGFPKGRFGNGVDWELAELDGKVKLVDTLPEISVKRKPLQIPQDYSIEAKINGLPEIIFSHKKHAVWNGCELCHPDIFIVKAGTTRYSMQDVFAGKYCGLCHGSVAFPATDCQRCHTKPVA
jgi:c(7)-type cytochrome triheme protein